VAVDGGARVGATVGGGLGVLVGGTSVGGSVGIGAGVSDGGVVELGATVVGEAVGDGTGVRLGWAVAVGKGVFVGRASAIRVLVGVGVTDGAPGPQLRASSAARDSRARVPNRPGVLTILLVPACHFDRRFLMRPLVQ
jgi:hypothetical protein